MNNTDTHILCEPYEIENYLDKNEIRVDTFIQKTIDIMESTINSNYNNLDSFENLDSELITSIMSIKIPSNVKIKKLNMYNTYSNTKELSLFIYILKEKTKKIFSLKNDSDIDEVKEYVEEFVDFINNIEDEYKSDKIFTDFGSITNFENIKSICDDSFFSPIKEWISSFPSTLLDIQLKTVSENNIIHTQKSYTVNESKENELDSLNLKRQILYLIYLLYNKIINNIIETKIFWNTFLDMVEPKNKNVLDEFMINTDEDELDIILKDINEFIDSESNEEDDELNDDFDTLDYLLGFEDDDNPMNTGARKGKNPFKVIGKFFATFPGKVNKIRKRFKLFRMRAKNHAFYMKYMGRIEGLYERYADEAPITENTMKGDPVMILKENGHEYISDVSNAFVDLQHELVNLSEKFASSSNPKEMLTMMKSFAGMYMSNTHKANSIPNNFITSLSFKLGEIILKGNKIYGYTT